MSKSEILHTVATDIAACLPGFTVEDNSEYSNYMAAISHADGRRFTFRGEQYEEPTRVEVTAAGAPKIRASIDRGGPAIARDIERKMMAAHIAWHADKATEKQAEIDAAAGRAIAVRRIAAAMPGATPGREDTAVWVPSEITGYHSVRINHAGETIDLELRSVPTSLAVQILALLSNHGRP